MRRTGPNVPVQLALLVILPLKADRARAAWPLRAASSSLIDVTRRGPARSRLI
jgi:hypothetical protein